MPAAPRFHTGGLHLTQDEALEYCLHHLHLAGLFYMTTGTNLAEQLGEARRMLGFDILGEDDPMYLGAVAFLQTSHAVHEANKTEDDA